jgi:hypothetical protein
MLNRLTILVLLGTVATAGLLFLRAETPAATEMRAAQQNSGSNVQQADAQHQSQNVRMAEIRSTETQEDLKIQRELANYTWWLAAATVLLVVVGAGQVLLLFRQERILHGALNEIHAQAEQMTFQTGVLEKSVAAAQKSADAAVVQLQAMKDKERARISVEILRLDTLEFGSGSNRAMLKFNNFGYTHALNVRASGDARAIIFEDKRVQIGKVSLPNFHAYETPIFEPLPFEFDDMGIPSAILANAPPVETWLGFIFPEEWEEEILRRPLLAIEVRGIIEYEDVFGDQHSTKFSYDMRIGKWGNVSPDGSAPIRPYSPFIRWFQSGGLEANQAT